MTTFPAFLNGLITVTMSYPVQSLIISLTSNKLSPTSATKSLLPFLSMILAACSAFLIEVKSKAAMSGWLFLNTFSSKFFSVPSVAYLTTSVTYSSSLDWSMFAGARSFDGGLKSCVGKQNGDVYTVTDYDLLSKIMLLFWLCVTYRLDYKF